MAPVSTSERDYLDQDPPVRGQNYVCLSFLSPEDAISSREAFAMGKFTDRLSEELASLMGAVGDVLRDGDEELNNRVKALRERYGYMLSGKAMREEYDAFMSANSSAITKEYSEVSDGATCVRGIKVRGCYETMNEARHRCESLKRSDPNFSVYVAEVGCWCPWSPDPDDLADAAGDQNVAQYSETALNTLMQKYQENVEEREQFYNERKRMLMSRDGGEPSGLTAEVAAEHNDRRDIMAELESEDNWSKAKLSGDGACAAPTEAGVGA